MSQRVEEKPRGDLAAHEPLAAEQVEPPEGQEERRKEQWKGVRDEQQAPATHIRAAEGEPERDADDECAAHHRSREPE